MTDIAGRDDDTLIAGQAALFAEVEKTFDLFVDAADGLDLALLAHRTGDGQVLPDRRIGQGRKQGADFGAGGAVALDAAIGLLKDQAGLKT